MEDRNNRTLLSDMSYCNNSECIVRNKCKRWIGGYKVSVNNLTRTWFILGCENKEYFIEI